MDDFNPFSHETFKRMAASVKVIGEVLAETSLIQRILDGLDERHAPVDVTYKQRYTIRLVRTTLGVLFGIIEAHKGEKYTLPERMKLVSLLNRLYTEENPKVWLIAMYAVVHHVDEDELLEDIESRVEDFSEGTYLAMMNYCKFVRDAKTWLGKNTPLISK